MGIPETATGVRDLMFKSTVFLSQFPFCEINESEKEVRLTLEGLVRVISLCQGKITTVLSSEYDISHLIFSSFAVKDEQKRENQKPKEEVNEDENTSLVMFNIVKGQVWNDYEPVKELESIGGYITGTDLFHLITFLLSIANLRVPNTLFDIAKEFEPTRYVLFKHGALNILRAIDPSMLDQTSLKDMKITYQDFKDIHFRLFPYLFQPLSEFYGLLLFNHKAVNRRPSTNSLDSEANRHEPKPLLPPVQGEINGLFSYEEETKLVNSLTMAQLAFMFGPEEIYGRLKKLYVGSNAGFSMRSFETKVFKWNAPSFMFIKGKIIDPDAKETARERAFNEAVRPLDKNGKQLTKSYKHVSFGIYIAQPWRASSKACFGDETTVLFQLDPVMDKFPSSSIKHDYVYFSRSHPGGIGIGSMPPQIRPSGNLPKGFSIGNVSLTLDESLEFGVFRHLGRGGSFKPSLSRPSAEWEDRFQISEVEVWGCGKDEDLEEQKKRWEWEEREAALRSKVNIDTMKEDRALLELAGLVGNHGSGGSV